MGKDLFSELPAEPAGEMRLRTHGGYGRCTWPGCNAQAYTVFILWPDDPFHESRQMMCPKHHDDWLDGAELPWREKK